MTSSNAWYDVLADWVCVTALFWVLFWKWQMWRLTRVRWVFVIMIGFFALLVVRLGIALSYEPISDSSNWGVGAILLFALGIPGLVLVLRRAYKVNGSEDKIESAAAIAAATEAARLAKVHAQEAALAAEIAEKHAQKAALLADQAALRARVSAKVAGAAGETARRAREE
jgi:hypothetical protein